MVNKKLTYREIEFLKKHNRVVKVEDTQGYSEVVKMYKKTLSGFTIHLKDNTTIKCSIIHNLLIDNEWTTASDIKIGDFLSDKYGNPSKEVIKIDKEPEQEWLDFEIDNEFETYIQNEVIHHNSGKSLIAYLFIMYMYKKNFKTLMIVPSINLVDQMFTDFQEYGLENAGDIIKQIGGEHKGTKDLSEKPCVISTWQSLQRMSKDNFDVFDAILVDECHTVKGEALQSIVANATSASWKLGMTGTVPRTKIDKLQLLGTLGKVNTVITPGDLITRGLATPININALYLNYSNSDRNLYNRDKPDYIKEKKFIETHYYRNLFASRLLIKLANKGNVLGLFTSIAHGESLLKMCITQRTGINNIGILHKITPKYIKEAIDTWHLNNKETTFFMNSPIDEKDKKKLLKNVTKIIDNELEVLEFISKVKSLDNINIFFMTGAVSGADREYIRKNLETVDAKEIKLVFDDKVVFVKENDNIPLEDGSTILGKDITLDSDILELWIKERV